MRGDPTDDEVEVQPDAGTDVELEQAFAEQTGRPLGTVKSPIRRSLAALRRHLEGIDGSP